jgi:hypothetical protein
MNIATTKDEGWRRDKQGATCCHAAETVRRPDNALAYQYEGVWCVFPACGRGVYLFKSGL